MQSGKSCQKSEWKTKQLACFSPLALAGRTKLTAKPFQREVKGGEGRRGVRREEKGGKDGKGKGGRRGKCDGENGVQPQVLQVNAEES